MLTTHISRDEMVQVNTNANSTDSMIKVLTRINSPTFFGSKVEEDLHGFIDEVIKVLDSKGVSSQ